MTQMGRGGGASPPAGPPPAGPPYSGPPPAGPPYSGPPPAGPPPAGPPYSGPPSPPPAVPPPADPVPPAGPGVVAPFPAPPRERNPRVWIGLIVVAALVLLCGGGGVAGVIGLGVYEYRQVSATVDKFLTAVEQQRYAEAYRMQCAPAKQRESEREFASGFATGPRLVRHQLATPQTLGQNAFEVPAQLWYQDGGEDQKKFVVVSQGSGQGGFAVCGETG
jgi:hypothetical protein